MFTPQYVSKHFCLNVVDGFQSAIKLKVNSKNLSLEVFWKLQTQFAVSARFLKNMSRNGSAVNHPFPGWLHARWCHNCMLIVKLIGNQCKQLWFHYSESNVESTLTALWDIEAEDLSFASIICFMTFIKFPCKWHGGCQICPHSFMKIVNNYELLLKTVTADGQCHKSWGRHW